MSAQQNKETCDADALWLYNPCLYLDGTAWHRLRGGASAARTFLRQRHLSSWFRAAMAAAVPARDTMAILLAIVATVAIVNGQIVFPKDERGVRDCEEGEVCVVKDSCLEYKKKVQERRDATAQDRPEDRAKMVEQLKAMVCHKAERKVCCPVVKGKNGERQSEREKDKSNLWEESLDMQKYDHCSVDWLGFLQREGKIFMLF